MNRTRSRIVNGFAIFVTVAILAAICFPMLQTKGSRRVICLSNLKRLALGLLEYAADDDDKLPNRDAWMDSSERYYTNNSIEHCDQVTGPGLYGYALNAALSNLSKVSSPATQPMAYDSVNLAKNASDLFNSLPAAGRHGGGNYIAYADDHAHFAKVAPERRFK